MLDFHNAENMDGITNVTNGNYCIKCITEFVHFWWINQS